VDLEITARLAAANGAAARLRSLWRRGRVGTRRKITFYKTAVLTVLLYGAESWPTTKEQVHRLEVFHQRNLREILGIHWTDNTSNPAVLLRAGLPSIADTITLRRFTWLGHIARMEDTRLIKQLLFSQQPGQRQRQRPRFTLRRAMQQDVTTLHGGQPNGRSWFQESHDRSYWRQALQALASGVTPGSGANGSAHRTNRRLSRN
jgi:hypothetical protein